MLLKLNRQKRLIEQPCFKLSLDWCNSWTCSNDLWYCVPNNGYGNKKTTVRKLGLGTLCLQSCLVGTRPGAINSLTTYQFSGQIWRLLILQCSIDRECQLVCDTLTYWQTACAFRCRPSTVQATWSCSRWSLSRTSEFVLYRSELQ